MAVKKSMMYLYNTMINLNIFSRRYFGSHVKRTLVKRLGQWATRLHIILFIIGLVILVLYTIVQPQAVTRSIDKPSFNLYIHLKQTYGNRLRCSCSMIASTYNRFIQIEPVFHEVCTSYFASDQWRINLTSGLVPDLSVYAQRDYRRFLSAHLQFLHGLCQLSTESIFSSINGFLTSLFIRAQLASEKEFDAHLDLLIEQNKLTAPITFERLFSLIRSINDGNAIVSTYGTNYEYISPWYWSSAFYPYVPSQAIIYDDGCSCALYKNCTTQASFTETNSSESISLKGLKMGCTPSESFLASTLECFYDQSCINLIQQYTKSTSQINGTYVPEPLSLAKSQFSINTTLPELINKLFVEQWKTTKNYSAYFQQCSPLLCSYVYIQNFNLLYIITLLLGLQGGLTIVLKCICPRIVRIVAKTCAYRKKRMIAAQPTISLEITSVDIVNLSIANAIPSSELISTNVPSKTNSPLLPQWILKTALKCLMIMFILIALVLFSIYIVRLEKEGITLTTSLTTPMVTVSTDTSVTVTATSTTGTMTSTKNVSVCQPTFQLTTNYTTSPNSGLKLSVIADFNGDKLLDVAFFSKDTGSIHVLFGNGNGTFRTDTQSGVGYFSGLNFIITVADFNTDNQSDLAFVNDNVPYVYIMLGNGDGTFRTPITIRMEDKSYSRGIATAHFNSDQYPDIVVANYGTNNVGVILGNGDGTFQPVMTYYTGRNSYPTSVTVADFNADNYQDIVVINFATRNVGVFLGHGNGTFEEQKTSFTGGHYYPSFIAVGDFNNDRHLDIVCSYNAGNRVGVMFGYGDGTLGAVTKFVVGKHTTRPRIAVADFNNDGHLDITVSPRSPSFISVLSGYGNGNFQAKVVFSAGYIGAYTWVDVADFNADGCPDILASGTSSEGLFAILNTCECPITKSSYTGNFFYSSVPPI